MIYILLFNSIKPILFLLISIFSLVAYSRLKNIGFLFLFILFLIKLILIISEITYLNSFLLDQSDFVYLAYDIVQWLTIFLSVILLANKKAYKNL